MLISTLLNHTKNRLATKQGVIGMPLVNTKQQEMGM